MAETTTSRQQWGSKLGFILAASGSAIGLGNIVFFSANAYKYGAGAFYVPYLLALLVVGLPLMILEFGLGQQQKRAFPMALGAVGGKWGEIAGWWALINALLITMYYITILGWVGGMWWSALVGKLWKASVALPAFGIKAGAVPNPVSSFFDLLSGWGNVGFVILVWGLNLFLLRRGTKSIEAGVKIMMPLMWVFMIALVIRGLTLKGGVHGVYLLFTPNFAVIKDPTVWQGAFSQIFFTLSLGFGVMTAYASYLPKKTDHVSNSIVVAGMNCTFEMIAGLAIFTMLFAFSISPKASTLSMMFFIVPAGIAKLPFGAMLFGVLFFTLLLMAGLSSSVSLIESFSSALQDKFPNAPRGKVLLWTVLVGVVGSVCFALPTVIDKGLASNGTLGLTLLDLIDHYAFGYGLLIVGLIECLIIGWMMPSGILVKGINEHAKIKIGQGYEVLIRYVIPAILLSILGHGIYKEFLAGPYGKDYKLGGMTYLPWVCLFVWLGLTCIGSLVLGSRKGASSEA